MTCCRNRLAKEFLRGNHEDWLCYVRWLRVFSGVDEERDVVLLHTNHLNADEPRIIFHNNHHNRPLRTNLPGLFFRSLHLRHLVVIRVTRLDYSSYYTHRTIHHIYQTYRYTWNLLYGTLFHWVFKCIIKIV